MTATVFLSPHYDDGVLSCGGTIASLARAGCEPLIVTVFGGETPEELVGDFARSKHARWGLASADEVLAVRRREDAAACAILGGRTRWLGHFDAIYRGDRFTAPDALYGKPPPVELGIPQLIADEVRSLPEWEPEATVYVPLAIGGHVDHRLTFAAGRVLAEQGVTVLAYEDCPYAIHTPGGVARRLAEIQGQVGEPILVPIGRTLQHRIDAIAAYATQVPVIFRFTEDVPRAVTEHALRTGGGLVPAERYWPVTCAPLAVRDEVRLRTGGAEPSR
jgi:LmbE family N-acetylglucosaminyl deacetylase